MTSWTGLPVKHQKTLLSRTFNICSPIICLRTSGARATCMSSSLPFAATKTRSPVYIVSIPVDSIAISSSHATFSHLFILIMPLWRLISGPPPSFMAMTFGPSSRKSHYRQMITFLLCHWMTKKDQFPSILDWWDALKLRIKNVSRMYGSTWYVSRHNTLATADA